MKRIATSLALLLAGCGDGGSSSGAPAWRLGPDVLGAPVGAAAAVAPGGAYLFGGVSAVHDPASSDVRFLDFSSGAVSPLAVAGGPPAARHGAAVAVAGDLLIAHGGRRPLGGGAQALYGDLWTLDLTASPPAWSEVTTAGAGPAPRYGHACVHDAARSRLIYFGGAVDLGQPAYDDVWALNLPGLTWEALGPAGAPPAARYLAQTALDGDRLIVFGGFAPGALTNDVWILDLAAETWTPLTTNAGPDPLYGAYAAWAVDRLLVFGGAKAPGASTTDEIWTLEIAGTAGTWTSRSAPGGPSARYAGASAWDGGRLWVLGGTTDPFDAAAATGEIWSLRR